VSKNYYVPRDWNLICDSCSKKIKASESKHRWDGFIVCGSCWEERQPQDFVRAIPDKISVPFSRPQTTDIFTDASYSEYVFDSALITDEFSRFVSYYRTFADSITVEDFIAVSKLLYATDSVEVSETSFDWLLNSGYTETTTIGDLLSMVVSKGLQDTVNITDLAVVFRFMQMSLSDSTTPTDAGTVSIPEYTTEDYFAEDYLAESVSF